MMQHDKRVRYSDEFGVFVLDMGSRSAEAMESGAHILTRAMEYARQAGNLPDCGCWAEGVTVEPTTGFVSWAEPVKLHKVFSQKGFSILGHGPVAEGSDLGANRDALNAQACPLANADGERQARELVQTGAWSEMWEATKPFPIIETVELQPSDAAKAPKAWTGDPIDIGRGRTVPGRHVPADVRKAAAAVAFVNGERDQANRAAQAAKLAAEEAPREAAQAVRAAAAKGERLSQDAAGAIIRERRDAADAAEAVADGIGQAADDARRSIVEAIEGSREAWLAYLHEHAAHNLARLDAALSEVEAAARELAEIDRIRQTVERPNATRLFGDGSFIETAAAQGIESIRDARAKASRDLGSLAKAR